MIKFADLSFQYKQLKNEINNVIFDVIENSSFIGGNYLKLFEQNFSNFIGTKYCIGCGNGTDAIEIGIESLNLPKNSEIIVPANSFIATSEAVTRLSHKVVFADYSKDDYTISLDSIISKFNSKTKVIILVHLYGYPCDMKNIIEFANKNKIMIIEDCSQAHGAMYRNKNVGTFGDISTFSFYPGKNLGAYGDGGAVLTNNSRLAKKIRMIANHGRIDKYNHLIEGRNSRLDNIQAGILNIDLRN